MLSELDDDDDDEVHKKLDIFMLIQLSTTQGQIMKECQSEDCTAPMFQRGEKYMPLLIFTYLDLHRNKVRSEEYIVLSPRHCPDVT